MKHSKRFDAVTNEMLKTLSGMLIKGIYHVRPTSKIESDNWALLLESEQKQLFTLIVKAQSTTGEKSLCLKDYVFCLEIHNYSSIEKNVTKEQRESEEKDPMLKDHIIAGFSQMIAFKEDKAFDYRELIIEPKYIGEDRETKENPDGWIGEVGIAFRLVLEAEDEESPFFEIGEKRVRLWPDFY